MLYVKFNIPQICILVKTSITGYYSFFKANLFSNGMTRKIYPFFFSIVYKIAFSYVTIKVPCHMKLSIFLNCLLNLKVENFHIYDNYIFNPLLLEKAVKLIICIDYHLLYESHTNCCFNTAHEQILQCAYNMQFVSYTQKIICCFLVVTCSLHVGLG